LPGGVPTGGSGRSRDGGDEPVDHHLDVVLVFLVERGRVLDVVELPVDPNPREAGFLPFGQLAAILALAAANDRREQIEPRPLGQKHHTVDHLRHGLGRDRKAGCRAVGHADPRPSRRI